MPFRKVKQHSDRGSIKDLAQKQESESPLLPSEIRLKRLFEFAQNNKDHNLQAALGFITTDYIHDKSALPLIVYRLRKTIADIKSKSPGKIEKLQLQFEKCFGINPVRIKTASAWKSPIFRRAS